MKLSDLEKVKKGNYKARKKPLDYKERTYIVDDYVYSMLDDRTHKDSYYLYVNILLGHTYTSEVYQIGRDLEDYELITDLKDFYLVDSLRNLRVVNANVQTSLYVIQKNKNNPFEPNIIKLGNYDYKKTPDFYPYDERYYYYFKQAKELESKLSMKLSSKHGGI